MEPRRAKDLAQLSDQDFLHSVSKGLSLVIENATRLYESARTLIDANHTQGGRLLTLISEEEAAKFLILIDAVRCPPAEAKIRARQLGYFSSHLARGIYANLCHTRPINLAELARYAEIDREEFFLDGPNDTDWIFRNRVLAEREEAIYVDYIKTNDGHEWISPRNDEFLTHLHMMPSTLRVSHALHKTGLTTPEGLGVVARIWRSLLVHPEMRWDEVEAKNKETLDELAREGVLKPENYDAYWDVIQHWPFPLYTLDLSLKDVDRMRLEKIRAEWSPDY